MAELKAQGERPWVLGNVEAGRRGVGWAERDRRVGTDQQ